MRRTSRSLALAALLTVAGAAGGLPATAFAQAPSANDALQAERTRLRAQLDKVNAEIDALKRAKGGVRDDYRLRARLADAESLARRLMDIEARLGIRVEAAPTLQPPPTAAPTDSPADLEAKADILADQSRRVRTQADTLARRAVEARGRQELRRRAADLDRDPFAPMEGSKRRVATAPGMGALPVPAAPSTFTGSRITGDTTQTAPPPLRDPLDTATLMEIRRLETSGITVGSATALEHAAAALRARADWLDAQSRAMRAKARAK
ncbi:MAG TPA: hypothetical protein VIF57_15320 [Polyangia bacterium]|jgi:hypothetical protein